jgi:MFS family permease
LPIDKGEHMTQSRFLSYENWLVFILGLMFGFVFFDRNAISFLMPFIVPDLGLSNTQVGILNSGLSLTWAVSGYLIGKASDATGKRRAYLVAAVVVFSLCSFGSGLAGSFMALLLARMVMGVAEGPTLPIAQSIMAIESSPHRRGRNMGLMQNVFAALLGSTVAPIVMVAVAEASGWRTAFFFAGAPGLLIAFLLWRFVREPGRVPLVAATAPAAVSSEPKLNTFALLRFRNMWLCSIICIAMVAWMVLGWTFLPLFYVNIRGFSPTDMGYLMSVLGICAAVGGFVVPAISDRVGRKPALVFFCLLSMLTPLAALYFEGSMLALGALVFIGWSGAGCFPLFMATVPAETVPARYLGTAFGLVMGMGELIGGVLSPTIAGKAADVYGQPAPIYIMVGCALVAGLLSFFLKETAPLKVAAANRVAMAA